ncbi:radical SAM protein [Myxococcota bacterium]
MTREPKQIEWLAADIEGARGHRLMVILAAPGCAFAQRTGGCTNCSFPQFFGVGRPVSAEEYLAQLEVAQRRIPRRHTGPVQLELFVSGSFFNPEEVSEDAQTRLLERTRSIPDIRKVVVETRPEYVTERRLTRAREAAGPVHLEVAIGLESASREIREKRIRKGFSWGHFHTAARLIAEHELSMLVHLLLKPIGTGEREGIEDVVDSGRRVFELGRTLDLPVRIGVQPCFVAPGSRVERTFEAGDYRPPWLWSLVEAVTRLAPLGPVYVGLSDEGMDPARAAYNCETCSIAVLQQLAAFNVDRDPESLTHICACRARWLAEVDSRQGQPI